MGKTATLLLKHRPTEERCAEIARHIASELNVPDGQVSWSVTDDVPEGYAVHLTDQLTAHRRDLPGAPVYLTVTVENR